MPIKLLVLTRRQPGQSRLEHFKTLQHRHADFLARQPAGAGRQVQNHSLDTDSGITNHGGASQVQGWDAVVELEFDSFQHLVAAMAGAAVPAIADEFSNIMLVETEELDVAVPTAKQLPGSNSVGRGSSCGFTVWQFIMREDDVYPEDFRRMWRIAHQAALHSVPEAGEKLRRCVLNWRSRLSDNDGPMRQRLRIAEPMVFDLVVVHGYQTAQQAEVFLRYDQAFRGDFAGFADWPRSKSLLTREIIVSNG